jgi:hypothetical protein
MGKLTNEIRGKIVAGWARYDTAVEIRREIRETYQVDVDMQQIYVLNPEGANWKGARRWEAVFAAERKVFLESASRIGIAQKVVRLQRLDKLCRMAIDKRNVKLAAELMEQAAKEMGEVFTNRREVRQDVRAVTATMSTEELRLSILTDLERLGADTQALLPAPKRDED